MKSLLFALALFVSVSAQATSLNPGFTLTLPKVVEQGKVTGLVARVAVSHITNEIRVQLFDDRCGQLTPKKPGTITCKMAAQLVEEYTVPVVETRTQCGSVYYIGSKDETPFDGLKVDIKVADHSKRTCMDVVAQYSSATLRTEALRTRTVRVVKMLNQNGF